jgi:DNA-binding NtrC family response regulator
MRQGKFREDLMYRLDVYNIQVPPLRARREDIPFLAQTFLKELAVETDKGVRSFTPAALEQLARHGWPGNIRELRNTVERALLSSRSESIDVSDLPPALHAGAGPGAEAVSTPVPAMSNGRDLDGWLADVERRAIQQALAECNGVQAHAARKLGISERSLWHRIKKLNIQINRVVN